MKSRLWNLHCHYFYNMLWWVIKICVHKKWYKFFVSSRQILVINLVHTKLIGNSYSGVHFSEYGCGSPEAL